MNNFLPFIFALFVLDLTGCSMKNPEIIHQNSPEDYVQGEILVKFQEGVSRGEIMLINARNKVEVIEVLSGLDVYHLRISPAFTVPAMLKKYKELPEVEYAEPNYKVRAF